ncbi:hypothetical protein ACOMICROBIO_LKFPLAJE_01938 [Vibrio sp. B1FIG11]|uniref:hypothetical protein n=1 Tax=Vibrio sp. B1FIG11 TaxID=2751177 RepID=UPI0015F3BB09|nr:hypothetical protein [Vibrio sp. B1FIG11]CAE6909106.1 hypothetical protein ACOMICROBIO_LKFPLAJE_01938 [Vibrio sp. B1FIG11]
MKLNSKNLRRVIYPALEEFFEREKSSIINDVSERNLCSRLAMYFEKQLSIHQINGYYADAEYNRKQEGQVKTIISDEFEIVSITCDLIMHSRGEIVAKDNLIALEMAKINKSEEDFASDRKRLMALTKSSYDDIWSADGKTLPEHVCGYVKGLYLIIDYKERVATLEHYANGISSKGDDTFSF